MSSVAASKSLSFSLIEPYLTFLKNHDDQITKLISLKDDGVLDLPIVETKITAAIIQMHDTVVKILNENSIIQSESEKSKNAMEIVVREVLKLSETFVSLSDSSQGRNTTEVIIKTVKSQLEKSLGAAKS